ncbi:MAG TPA: glycosyltransferase, partial [Propionibacteriaceae bacterium]|nr:glycosyltransferase [Propionibacteriaceae bacterium]
MTRYNIPVRFAKERNPLDPEWLDDRDALFRQLCLPSIEQQTDQDFTWMVFFHPETPLRYYEDLRERYTVLFAHSPQDMLATVRGRVTQCRGPVVTTRFDNDDCLSKRFVSTTKGLARIIVEQADLFSLPHVIRYAWGLYRDASTGAVREKRDTGGPFVSLVEHAESGCLLQTAFAKMHDKMNGSFNSTVIENKVPMWLINIHGGNAGNRFPRRGMTVSDEDIRRELLCEFPDLPIMERRIRDHHEASRDSKPGNKATSAPDRREFDVNAYWLKRGKSYIDEKRLVSTPYLLQEQFIIDVLRSRDVPMR